jgi:hypothetical protein
MSVYMPIIKLTQRRKGAKNLRTFYYGYATGHDIKYCDNIVSPIEIRDKYYTESIIF